MPAFNRSNKRTVRVPLRLSTEEWRRYDLYAERAGHRIGSKEAYNLVGPNIIYNHARDQTEWMDNNLYPDEGLWSWSSRIRYRVTREYIEYVFPRVIDAAKFKLFFA